MTKRKRKILLKGFEQHFILLSFLTVSTALAAAVALVVGVLWLLDPMLLGGATMEDILYLCALALGMLATTYYYSLSIDHRVSGPVYSLMRNLERLGEGDLTTEMRLRHQDHLQEISNTFNRNVQTLRQRIGELQELAMAAQQAQAEPERKQLLERLCDNLQSLKTRSQA